MSLVNWSLFIIISPSKEGVCSKLSSRLTIRRRSHLFIPTLTCDCYICFIAFETIKGNLIISFQSVARLVCHSCRRVVVLWLRSVAAQSSELVLRLLSTALLMAHTLLASVLTLASAAGVSANQLSRICIRIVDTHKFNRIYQLLNSKGRVIVSRRCGNYYWGELYQQWHS